jgi:hypothetical protein
VSAIQVLIGQQVIVMAPGVDTRAEMPTRDPEVDSTRALDKAPPIDVNIVDENGRGLAGATVTADYGLANVSPVRTQSDSSGRASLKRLSNRVLIVAELPGKILSKPVEDQAEATIYLVTPARIEGQILPKVPGKVVLVDPILGQPVRDLRTKANGSFVIDGLTPGKYVIELECAGFQNRQLTITLPLANNKLTIPLLDGGHEHLLPKDLRDKPK